MYVKMSIWLHMHTQTGTPLKGKIDEIFNCQVTQVDIMIISVLSPLRRKKLRTRQIILNKLDYPNFEC